MNTQMDDLNLTLFSLSISEVRKKKDITSHGCAVIFFQIIRDAAGAPDVLTRLEGPQPNPIDGAADAVISEYES
jgi:hypothetical protein